MSVSRADVATCLERAAELIEMSFWRRGPRVDNDTAICAMEALMAAADLPINARAAASLRVRLFPKGGAERAYPNDPGIPFWNDFVASDAAEVVATLRQVAQEIKEGDGGSAVRPGSDEQPELPRS